MSSTGTPVPMNPMNYVRDFGIRAAVDHIVTYVLTRLFWSGFHKRAVPLLEELYQGAASVYESPRDFLAHERLDSDLLDTAQILQEYADLSHELAARYTSRTLPYPNYYELEQGSSLLMYALLRRTQPERVVETGVANGASTFYLLNALLKNGHGRLDSVDVRDNVGALLNKSEKQSWRLTILRSGHRGMEFKKLIADGPKIDVFMHDSDHRYLWQSLEIDAAYSSKSDHATIACDDVDSSYAFLDFCGKVGMKPTLLLEKRKVFGLVHFHNSTVV